MKKTVLIILLALVVVAVAVFVFLDLQAPVSQSPVIGVEQPIPEGAAPPPGVSRFTEWNLALYQEGITPDSIKTVYGGQTIRLRVTAIDNGYGEGYVFEIPGLDVQERVQPGNPVSLEITPTVYNNYAVRSTAGGITHTSVLIVIPADRE